MRRASLLAAFAAAASASCQLVYGLDDFHPTGSTSSGGAAVGGGGGGASSGAGGAPGGGGPVGGAPECGADSGAGCVTTPPGFAGYFHLVTSTPELAPNRCTSGAKPKHFYQDPIAACSMCSCDPAPTPPCSSPDIDSFLMSNCPAGDGNAINHASGSCTATFGLNVKAAAPQALSCPALGGKRTTDDWMTEITLCEVATGSEGCANGQDCVETGEAICVLQGGVSGDCPAGWGAPMVVYDHADDSLTCNACSCTPTFACAGQYLAYQGAENPCLTGSTPIPAGTCTAASYVAYDAQPTTGELGCTPSGGGSTGSFTPAGASTVCCKMP